MYKDHCTEAEWGHCPDYSSGGVRERAEEGTEPDVGMHNKGGH